MASKLKVDLDAIEHTISQYDSAANEFNNILTSLDKSVELLKNSGWDSEASKAYFSSFDETWKKNMLAHIKSISFMRNCLKEAGSDYEGLQSLITDIDRAFDQ